MFVGAGDIAGTWPDDTATGQLVSGIPGNVFTIGDNAYETGTAAEFVEYNNTWGGFKARTRPAAGNHDYGNGATPGATPYFDYFNGVGNQTGPAGDRALGYYSYNIGSGPSTWHVVVLNSECEPGTGYWLPGGCAAGSAQDLWLKNDLATAPTNNIIAIWHKPRWASAGNHTHMQALWQDLYDGGADILLGGHWHNYERLAPMDASGAADASFGVRQFVVGTGGASLSGFGTILPTSEVRDNAHPRRDEVHAPRLELRLAVHPDRRPDVHRLGHLFDPWSARSGERATGRRLRRRRRHRRLGLPPRRPVRRMGHPGPAALPRFWGLTTDIPVPGNYDGDRATEVAVFHRGPQYGEWHIQGQSPYPQLRGLATDVPVPGDYDGDGDSDVAVFHRVGVRGVVDPAASSRCRSGACANDIPVPGDYDGDGCHRASPSSTRRRRTGSWSSQDLFTCSSGALPTTSPSPPTTTATATPTSPSSIPARCTGSGASRASRPSRSCGALPTTSPCPATTTATPPASSPSSTAAPAVRGVVDPGPVAADLGRALRHPTTPPARAVRAAPDRWVGAR